MKTNIHSFQEQYHSGTAKSNIDYETVDTKSDLKDHIFPP